MEIQTYTEEKDKIVMDQDKFLDEFLATYGKLATDRMRREAYLKLITSIPNYRRMSFISFAMACRLIDLLHSKKVAIKDVLEMDRESFIADCKSVIKDAVDTQIIKTEASRGKKNMALLIEILVRYYRKLVRRNVEDRVIKNR